MRTLLLLLLPAARAWSCDDAGATTLLERRPLAADAVCNDGSPSGRESKASGPPQ